MWDIWVNLEIPILKGVTKKCAPNATQKSLKNGLKMYKSDINFINRNILI